MRWLDRLKSIKLSMVKKIVAASRGQSGYNFFCETNSNRSVLPLDIFVDALRGISLRGARVLHDVHAHAALGIAGVD